MFPEWVEITITVPKLTGTIEGKPWRVAERGNEIERTESGVQEEIMDMLGQDVHKDYWITVTASTTTALDVKQNDYFYIEVNRSINQASTATIL